MSIILDTHEFLADTALRAQWGGGVRKLYRHSSNEGSVIEIDYWGSPMKLFVADAKYRAARLAYDTTMRAHGNPQLSVSNAHFNGATDDPKKALTYNKDDTWIQNTYAALKNDGTAKSNTDILMGFSTTRAAHYCRSQDIPGVGQLDLPNLYELIILYLESDNIDALDPTAESNRDKALGMMNTCCRFNFGNQTSLWSSTENNGGHAWYIFPNGNANNGSYQNLGLGVAPVKEL